jgi:hydrogenase maturation protease
VDAGVAPENHLEKVVAARPDTLLLVDAADWGGRPGSLRLLAPDASGVGGLSTHALSLDLVAAYWAERLPAVRIHLLAIQPAALEWEAGLSPAVAKTVERLAQCLQRFGT